MWPQLKAMGLGDLFYKLEMPLVGVLAELEHNGIIVDAAELDRQRSRLQSKLTQILSDLDAEAKRSILRTFDPDSPKQLSAAALQQPRRRDAGAGHQADQEDQDRVLDRRGGAGEARRGCDARDTNPEADP